MVIIELHVIDPRLIGMDKEWIGIPSALDAIRAKMKFEVLFCWEIYTSAGAFRSFGVWESKAVYEEDLQNVRRLAILNKVFRENDSV